MDKRKDNNTLKITFHNPNTKDATLSVLMKISAEIACAKVRETVVHI